MRAVRAVLLTVAIVCMCNVPEMQSKHTATGQMNVIFFALLTLMAAEIGGECYERWLRD
jgi:hypothetical protein